MSEARTSIVPAFTQRPDPARIDWSQDQTIHVTGATTYFDPQSAVVMLPEND